MDPEEMHLEDPKMTQTIIFTRYFLTEFKNILNKTKHPDFSDLKLMHIWSHLNLQNFIIKKTKQQIKCYRNNLVFIAVVFLGMMELVQYSL